MLKVSSGEFLSSNCNFWESKIQSDAQVSGNVTTSTKRASKKGIDLLRRSSEEPTPQVLIL